MNQSDFQTPRRQRTDARANRDKLVAAARALFGAKGTSAPLEEVADQAGVGIGTLYRHFPTRKALFEAVFIDEVEVLARAADELTVQAPWDALARWLRQYVGFAATKRALNEALMEEDPGSDVLLTCRSAITNAAAGLVGRAQQEGVVRIDLDFMDILRMVGAIAMVPGADDAQKERMLEVALDGLRYRANVVGSGVADERSVL